MTTPDKPIARSTVEQLFPDLGPEVRIAALQIGGDYIFDLAEFLLEQPAFHRPRNTGRLRVKVVRWAMEFTERSVDMFPLLATWGLWLTDRDERDLTDRERRIRWIALRLDATCKRIADEERRQWAASHLPQ
jgi:hypothetical protein